MKKISDKTLKKSFFNWFFWNGCSQQAESMLGLAFGQSMAPVIEELYDTKEEKAEALKRHITLFNTESQVGSICNGVVCGLEEANANKTCTPELISSVKVALIGPTAAIGDSLWVATFIPILLTICLSISQTSQTSAWLGPIIYMIVYPIGTCILSWYLFKLGYKSGIDGMQGFMSTGKLNSLTDTMTVLGLIVVGALTASFVNFTLPIQIIRDVFDPTTGEMLVNQVIFDADKVVNSIFPKILPLLLTLVVYYLYSKKKMVTT
jgi:PTS system mannose-specific IID component